MATNPEVDQTAPIVIEGCPPSEQMRRQLADEGKPVLLAFSRGKDSVASWLALREAGVQVRPFHLYTVPNLEFIDSSLRRFEDFFEMRIPQLPHPSMFRFLNALVFQAPENCAVIEAANLPEPDYTDISRMLCELVYGLDPLTTWTADGVRAADSPNRRTATKLHGPWRKSVLKVSPVWDWRIRHVRAAIEKHDPPMPIDYEWFGKSFDGLDWRFLEPIRRNAPDDYEKILSWFPLAHLEFFRRDLKR